MFDERDGRISRADAPRRWSERRNGRRNGRRDGVRAPERRGVVLLIVSIVIAMLTLSGATLLFLLKTEREATTTRGQEALVKSVDRSAVVFLLGTLETSRAERDKIGGVYDNPAYFCATPLLTIDEGGGETSRFTVVSPKFDEDKIEGVRYGLVDESSRLNLSAVLDWDAESPGAGRAALMKLPGMTAVAADSILDWIDADEKARANGGESKYYSNQKLPYSPRNAVPVFLEELLLARGVTRLQLYGSDEDFTFGANKIGSKTSDDSALVGTLTTSPAAARTASGGDAEAVPWKELLTVFSAEKDVDPKGEARVDLNVDDLSFLYQELAPRVGEDLAKFAVLYRQYGPASDSENENGENAGNARNGGGYGRRNATARSATSTTQSVSATQLDFSVPATVAFETPLDLVGASVSVDGTLVASPIRNSRSKADADTLFQLLDFASTSPSTTLVGRVNVNAAPTAVLSAIPGLTSADVRKILDERPNPKDALPDDYRHASWLYTKGVVGLAKMKKLYGKTTAFGDVFRGQIVGFLDGTDVSARADVVVDGTTNPPRQVFYKDLTMTGKGFSDAVLLGGTTTGNAANSLGSGVGSAFDSVDDALGVVEIENSGSNGTPNGARTSGYASPFAAVDRDAASLTPDAGGGNSNALDVAPAPEISKNPGISTAPKNETTAATGTIGVPDISSETTETPDASDDAETTAPAASTEPESRKDRLLNALRSARETRKASNEAAATREAERDTAVRVQAAEALGGE